MKVDNSASHSWKKAGRVVDPLLTLPVYLREGMIR